MAKGNSRVSQGATIFLKKQLTKKPKVLYHSYTHTGVLEINRTWKQPKDHPQTMDKVYMDNG